MLDTIRSQTRAVADALLEVARLREGDILVVGCSSSEVLGQKIASHSSPEVASGPVKYLLAAARPHGRYMAVHCCEQLTRAIIIEAAAAEKYGLEPVNVVPQPKAGGSFATAAYTAFEHPVAVEHIAGHAGIDIGDTLIGMHLRHVAVPVRTPVRQIGEAHVVCARTRPKFIGGVRAHYDETQL